MSRSLTGRLERPVGTQFAFLVLNIIDVTKYFQIHTKFVKIFIDFKVIFVYIISNFKKKE